MLTTFKKRLSSFSALGPEGSTCSIPELYTWTLTLHVHMVHAGAQGEKRAPDPLGLELQSFGELNLGLLQEQKWSYLL